MYFQVRNKYGNDAGSDDRLAIFNFKCDAEAYVAELKSEWGTDDTYVIFEVEINVIKK